MIYSQAGQPACGPQTQSTAANKMSILKRLGLTKESMEKMLGPVTPFKDTDPKIPRRWEAIPDDIREAVLKEHQTFTCRELGKKYGISSSCAWNIKNKKNKQTNKQ